jgi:two-component system CheB/CheR fusion protein
MSADPIIARSRVGIYPESIAMDMSSERPRRHFQKVDGGYQISKTIRDMCVFAKQDLTKDPPFSKIHKISCRNVMIYMGQVLQQRIIPLFHSCVEFRRRAFLGASKPLAALATCSYRWIRNTGFMRRTQQLSLLILISYRNMNLTLSPNER